MKTLEQQAAELRGKAQQAHLKRTRIQRAAAITSSAAWPDYKSELQGMLERGRDELENCSLTDPHDIGEVRGRLKFIRKLLSLEEMQVNEVAMLSKAEKSLRQQADAKDKFQTRQHTGEAL